MIVHWFRSLLKHKQTKCGVQVQAQNLSQSGIVNTTGGPWRTDRVQCGSQRLPHRRLRALHYPGDVVHPHSLLGKSAGAAQSVQESAQVVGVCDFLLDATHRVSLDARLRHPGRAWHPRGWTLAIWTGWRTV